jgi:hypothetical protein
MLTTALVLVGVLAVGGAASAASPQGDAKGIQLLKRVQAAYRHVPAVRLTGRLGQVRSRFFLLLSKGAVTAEEYHGTAPNGVTILVARGTGPTYARQPGTACWTLLRKSNPQSLTDLGERFPEAGKKIRWKLKAPRRAGAYWLLPVSQGGHHGTMRIDAKTFLLKTFTAVTSNGTVVEHDQALSKRPMLPTPRPRC